jgi:hypothetical protein
LATQDERFTPFLVIEIKGNDLTFGLGIIILQDVSSRKSLAGVNMMNPIKIQHVLNVPTFIITEVALKLSGA